MGKGSMTAHATPNEPDYPPPPGGPPPPADIGRLLLRCHDRPGIIAAVSTFLARAGAKMSVVMVIANHPDLAAHVRPFGVPFIHIPATRDTRTEAEQRQLQLLSGNVDLVVLARYMQILSPGFLEAIGCPLINIHHSFLPAFTGAAPYQRARERGVKLIGATAHYVTEVLDEGPIIEQDVVRVDHTHTVDDLVRVGADVERAVLSRAVLWHCQDRVIVHHNQTIVF